MIPTTSADFDRAYEGPVTPWGDVRVPPEVKALVTERSPRRVLELGCGLGRFSRWIAKQGVAATAVDFSAVAIAKAKARAAGDASPPDYRVGDVTRLEGLTGPFDAAFDVGCFHCLDERGQRAYAAEAARLLVSGAPLLIWTLDDSPSDLPLAPPAIERAFASLFVLRTARASRRRVLASHWYMLERL